MPAAPDFRLYHSNALDVLAGLLAAELRRPAPGQPLLAPDTVLVPQVAMRRWLQATLAKEYGIAANLEFLTPGEFVRRALDANVAGADEDLDASALHWRLYAALTDADTLREPALHALRGYLAGDDPLKPWSLAGELASVFEKYQAWRRDWLLAWEAGEQPRDAQAALWRRVARGQRHRARRIDDYLARFNDATAPLPAGLPPRLFAFATLNISPDVLRVIATQARVGPLHFYLPTPTRKYWGDLATLGERLRAGEAAFDPDENPLLQAWGAAGRDFMAVLGGYEVVHPSGEFAAYDDAEERDPDGSGAGADTLLQRLQHDLLHRRGPSSPAWRNALDAHDPSVQVHACHTRLREVQVLHDQLRGLLEDPRFDPPLQPREIAVLAPDIDPYVPHIAAVFGGGARHDAIPYALADTSPMAAEPLAAVFLQLLALPVSRFGLSEVLDLLATPALADAAQLDAAALERLHGWLREAGARWGLDAAHRSRHDAPRDDACTWAFALDRLLLGHASDDEAPILGVAPYTEMEGSALDALDALIRVLRVLARHERVLATAMPPALWRERLLDLLAALLPEHLRSGGDQRARERLHGLLDDFASAAAAADFVAPVPPEVVRAHFQAALAQADTRAPLLTGGISFGRMVPMRLLPFRVIALLGMNDGDYPRRDPAGGLNKLAADLLGPARRHGDRSLREDDRFLFLQLFAAASDVLYLSYLGADPRDGSEREPSVLVSELLDTAARYHAEPAAVRKAFTVRHPLQPFAPAAFGAGANGEEPRRYSYRGEWRPAAQSQGGERQPLGAWLRAPLPARPREDAPEELSLTDLRKFLRDPCEAFLRQRLHLRLPEESDAQDDTEPLTLPGRGLQHWQLQHAVFDACVAGIGDELAARLRARAMLPSGPMGMRQLERVRATVQPYADAFREWRRGAPRTVNVDVELDGIRLYGRIEDVYADGLARLRFDELHGPAQIAHGLDWLVLCALGEAQPLWQFALRDKQIGPHRRDPVPTAQAQAALRALLCLRERGLREALPFLPRSGWVWYQAEQQASAASARASKSPWDRARETWAGGNNGWSESQTASAQLVLRGHDPFADDALGAQFRAIATRVFDAVVLGRSAVAA
ncbi:exodeoxyribonuclease V subunit gamma [Lysobacter solisilvae (ex Woo and Kim 2020)]|uniref:RecBCD enzyme subunit RecC n=1 Tax=Agrilutibacter terrestris TaxID=2865112 RepID=A0A7H0FTN6_9GAMM|nr:exodeoxyribonuclease V subunit gamma [Lysobacter terrestris]QNP39402.1 exodeoxyribonuclease V subunit gamma [Lysobacter terrestris]